MSINPIQPSEATEWLKDLILDHADAEDPVDVGAMSYRLRFMGRILNGNSIPNGNMKLRGLVASVAFLILIVSEWLGDVMKNGSSILQAKLDRFACGPLYIWVLDPRLFSWSFASSGSTTLLGDSAEDILVTRHGGHDLVFPRCIVMHIDLIISTCLILSFYFSMCCFLIIHEASMSKFIFFKSQPFQDMEPN